PQPLWHGQDRAVPGALPDGLEVLRAHRLRPSGRPGWSDWRLVHQGLALLGQDLPQDPGHQEVPAGRGPSGGTRHRPRQLLEPLYPLTGRRTPVRALRALRRFHQRWLRSMPDPGSHPGHHQIPLRGLHHQGGPDRCHLRHQGPRRHLRPVHGHRRPAG
ncbi:hypothetical protein LTR53_019129, partial [Teratosphaeriaceae sp. CCFEE 6253]